MDKFMVEILVMVSQVYTCFQTYQIVYIKYVQVLHVNHNPIKWFFKKEK